MLKGIYTSLDSVAAFGGVNDLVRESGLSVKQVKEFLQSSKTYTKFRPNRKRFKRLRVHSLGINHVWSVDLAHMDKLAAENDGYQYLLVCVDTFSRFLRVQPMKDKQSETALVALKKMLHKARADYPLKIWVAQGKEFCGAPKNVRPEHTVDLLKKNVPDMLRKWRPRKTSRKFSKKSQSSKKVKLFEYRASANQLLTKVILKISPMKSSKLLLFLDPFATTTKKTPAPSPTA